jgi:hypothetical protein
MNAIYLPGIKKQFEFYKSLADKTVEQIGIADEKLFWQYNEASNSIAVIVKHLSGNLLSRWTDFLITDGEKDSRDRDGEFDNSIQSKEELLDKWNEAWKCLFEAINSLTEDDLNKTIYIRNMGHSVLDAINRSMAHTAYHVGQIVFIGKMIQSTGWNSLSIAKGNSKEFNADKFSKARHDEHFTDQFINKKE